MQSSITFIGDYAFFKNNIKTCIVGNSLAYLGAFSFSSNASQLTKIYTTYQKQRDGRGNLSAPIVHIYGDYSGEKFIHSESLIHGNKDKNKTFSTNGEVYFCPYAFKEVYKGNRTSTITNFNFSQDEAFFATNAFAGTNFSELTYEGSFKIIKEFPNDSIITATINTDITESLKQSKLKSLIMDRATISDGALPLSLITL